MDFLSFSDEPIKQWRWRVAEEVSESMQEKLGVRPEGRRPALWRKHDVLIGVFCKQIKQHTAHQQRQQGCVHQDLYHVLLARVELIQLLLRLQFAEQQLYFPPTSIQRR